MADTKGQLSEDGLWQWSGKKWVHVELLDIACVKCQKVTRLEQGRPTFKCPDGHKIEFVACNPCKAVYQRADWREPCPQCGAASIRGQVTAWDWKAHQTALGDVVPDGDRRFLSDFFLAAGGGTRIPTNTPCLIDFIADRTTIKGAGIEESVPYAEMDALQISGSTTRSGANVFGGGFGIAGAAEGMLAAGVINSLTSKTTTTSVLRVAARTSEYVFVSHATSSATLGMLLTPVQLRIRQAQPAPAPPPCMAPPLAFQTSSPSSHNSETRVCSTTRNSLPRRRAS
jgi:hypothetical protein